MVQCLYRMEVVLGTEKGFPGCNGCELGNCYIKSLSEVDLKPVYALTSSLNPVKLSQVSLVSYSLPPHTFCSPNYSTLKEKFGGV